MKIICVTGQMAAGKNFICSNYEKDGWVSIDADLIAHKAIEEKKTEIAATFKTEIEKSGLSLYNDDGTINRKNLGAIVFSDPSLLKKQEEIVYPYIENEIINFINLCKDKNPDSKIIINATVLYKTPRLLSMCEKIIFVKANFIKRFFRAKKRDKLSGKKILLRFKNQKTLFKEYSKTNIPIEIVKN